MTKGSDMWRDGVVTRLRQTLEHPAWGEAHSRRLYALCEQIAESEQLDVDDDVMFALAWFHDLGTFGEFACAADDPPTCAAQAAERILPETGFPAEKVELVARIIAEHNFEGEGRDTEEARVLRDADMLEFLGAVGIARLFSIVEIEDWVPDPRAAVGLAMQFADELPGRMFFETSRVMAEVRADETRDFIESLSAETVDLELL